MDALELHIEFIKKFILLTSDKKITWKRQSLSTLYYEKTTTKGEMARLTLQKIGYAGSEDYMFSVSSPFKNEISLNIDTSRQPKYKNYIAELYRTALLSVDQDGLNLLSDLIDSIG